jgi:hypothetical protein
MYNVADKEDRVKRRLKSDWKRWSVAERISAVVLMGVSISLEFWFVAHVIAL